MGSLRALTLLFLMLWREAVLMAAMATGMSSFDSFEVSTSIKAYSYPLLLPALYYDYESGMVSISPKPSKGRSFPISNNINSGDLHPLQISGDLGLLLGLGVVEPPSSSMASVLVNMTTKRPRPERAASGSRARSLQSASAMRGSRSWQPPGYSGARRRHHRAAELASPASASSFIGGEFKSCGAHHSHAWSNFAACTTSYCLSGIHGLACSFCMLHTQRRPWCSSTFTLWDPLQVLSEKLHFIYAGFYFLVEWKYSSVLQPPGSARQLLLWRWFDNFAFIWVFGSSSFCLRRRHQQHSSVDGLFLLQRLHQPTLHRRRCARSVHQDARVFDAPAIPHRQNHHPLRLSRRCCLFFRSQDLYVIRSSKEDLYVL